MKFELTILGCGSATPTLRRRPTSQLLNYEEQFYLIDCGEGTQLQLRQYRKRFLKIDHIFISHLHGDHYFGLIGLLSTMHLLGRTKEISIFAPPNLKKIIKTELELSDSVLRFPVKWVDLVADEKRLILETKGLQVFSFPLKHRISCTGFLFSEKQKPRKMRKDKISEYKLSVARIRQIKNGADYTLENGKIIPNSELTNDPGSPHSYAYCSDTAYYPEVGEWVKGVDLLYHESTFLEEDKERAEYTLHSTAMQAATIAKNAGVKKLLLGHFSARYKNLEPFITEARSVFEDTQLAEEGQDYLIRV